MECLIDRVNNYTVVKNVYFWGAKFSVIEKEELFYIAEPITSKILTSGSHVIGIERYKLAEIIRNSFKSSIHLNNYIMEKVNEIRERNTSGNTTRAPENPGD